MSENENSPLPCRAKPKADSPSTSGSPENGANTVVAMDDPLRARAPWPPSSANGAGEITLLTVVPEEPANSASPL